jgi:hypothetical protein
VPVTPDAMTSIAAILEKLSSQTPAPAQSTIQVYPQNARHPGISAFSHPEGDVARPKPVLRPGKNGQPGLCFFCGSKEDPDTLTPHQIDLYNRFDRTRTSREGRWRAEVSPNGVDLSVTVPCKTLDERMDLPSLDIILTELLDGAAAVDPISLAQRVQDLERQLAAK